MSDKPTYEELERRVQILEEALHDREAILDRLPDHVVIQDLEHRILWSNKTACNSLGLDRSEIMNRKCHELWASRSNPCSDCPMPEALQNSAQASIEKITPDGKSWRIRCCPLPDRQGQQTRVLEVTEDISEDVRNRKIQRESEEIRELILDTMQEMLAYHDTNLRVKWANKAAAESVGKKPEDLIGLHCYKIWQQRDVPCEDCPVVKALETGSDHEIETATPDGRIYKIRGYPIYDENKNIIGAH